MMPLVFPEKIDWHSPIAGEWFLPLPGFDVRPESAALLSAHRK
jgi:hypothetical protein